MLTCPKRRRTPLGHGTWPPLERGDIRLHGLPARPGGPLIEPLGNSAMCLASREPRRRSRHRSAGLDIIASRLWQVVALAGLLFGTAYVRDARAVDLVDALQAKSLLDDSNLTLVDVRTADERAAHGIPQGSIWIEWRGAESAAAFIEALQAAAPDRSRALAFICSVGHRSGQAARLAERDGYRRVFDVTEGVNGSVLGPGWRLWGLPLVAGRPPLRGGLASDDLPDGRHRRNGFDRPPCPEAPSPAHQSALAACLETEK